MVVTGEILDEMRIANKESSAEFDVGKAVGGNEGERAPKDGQTGLAPGPGKTRADGEVMPGQELGDVVPDLGQIDWMCNGSWGHDGEMVKSREHLSHRRTQYNAKKNTSSATTINPHIPTFPFTHGQRRWSKAVVHQRPRYLQSLTCLFS